MCENWTKTQQQSLPFVTLPTRSSSKKSEEERHGASAQECKPNHGQSPISYSSHRNLKYPPQSLRVSPPTGNILLLQQNQQVRAGTPALHKDTPITEERASTIAAAQEVAAIACARIASGSGTIEKEWRKRRRGSGWRTAWGMDSFLGFFDSLVLGSVRPSLRSGGKLTQSLACEGWAQRGKKKEKRGRLVSEDGTGRGTVGIGVPLHVGWMHASKFHPIHLLRK